MTKFLTQEQAAAVRDAMLALNRAGEWQGTFRFKTWSGREIRVVWLEPSFGVRIYAGWTPIYEYYRDQNAFFQAYQAV